MTAKEIILKAIQHRTYENPISNIELAQLCRRYGLYLTTEKVRDEIRLMRKEGLLILSKSSAGGGYYMAQSMEDYQEFRRVNYFARISDMLETMRVMDYAAEREYKTGLQERLF